MSPERPQRLLIVSRVSFSQCQERIWVHENLSFRIFLLVAQASLGCGLKLGSLDSTRLHMVLYHIRYDSPSRKMNYFSTSSVVNIYSPRSSPPFFCKSKHMVLEKHALNEAFFVAALRINMEHNSEGLVQMMLPLQMGDFQVPAVNSPGCTAHH